MGGSYIHLANCLLQHRDRNIFLCIQKEVFIYPYPLNIFLSLGACLIPHIFYMIDIFLGLYKYNSCVMSGLGGWIALTYLVVAKLPHNWLPTNHTNMLLKILRFIQVQVFKQLKQPRHSHQLTIVKLLCFTRICTQTWFIRLFIRLILLYF